MSVVYVKSDSIGRKIVPAPLISIDKKYQSNPDGTKKGTIYSIVLKGTLLPHMGSPSGNYSSIDNSFWTLGGYPPDSDGDKFDAILRKQEALRWLFNEDGGSLEWQPAGGEPPVKCHPKILSINFSEAQWVDRCDYIIELEAPWLYLHGTTSVEDSIAFDLLSSSAETWSFEETEGRNNQQYKVSHEVNAQGILGYDETGGLYESKQAWEHAKDFVDTQIDGTVDSDIMFAALGASDQITGHYSTVIRVDKDGGSYGVTEEWVLSDSATYEERQFTVEYDPKQDEYSITYQGTIYGVSTDSRDGNVANMNVARAAVPLIGTARTTTLSYIGSLLGDKSVPDLPDKRTFSLNQQDGTVNFTYQWNTSDNNTVFISEEAQHSYSIENLLNTLTYTQTAEGKGSDRMIDAKASIYSNGLALTKAKALAGTSLTYNLLSVVKSFSAREGTIRVSWTWTDKDTHSKEITIQTQESVSVLAIIPIPGRGSGPLIQTMNTKTSEITTVVIRSKGHTSQPALSTTSYATGIIIGDNATWNPTTGVAERTTRFLK